MAPNIPKTCKAAVCKGVNQKLVIEQVPVPQPQAGEILVKVHACGVCHSDSGAMEGLFSPIVQYPIILGHEIIGTVVAVGTGEKKWKVGDRVGGPWHGGHDGTCKNCNRGFYQTCENEAINGVSRNGGYSEYCVLRTEAAVRIPPEVEPADDAPLLCAGVTTFNGLRNQNIMVGDVVAIEGLGGLGHLAVQFSRKMGYRTVALSSSASKRDFAMELGATDYIDSSKESTVEALQKMGGAALIVVTAPNPKIIGPLIEGLAPKGKVLVLSPVGDVTVSTTPMINKAVSIGGWPSGHALDSEECISFAKHQGVKVMVEKFPLDKAQEAVEYMLSGKVRFRVVLTMD